MIGGGRFHPRAHLRAGPTAHVGQECWTADGLGTHPDHTRTRIIGTRPAAWPEITSVQEAVRLCPRCGHSAHSSCLSPLLTSARSGENVEKLKSGALRLDEPLIDCYNLLGYAEVAEWQTRRSQKPLGINPRVGSSPTFGTTTNDSGAWLSLVERRVRVAEVGGSNPLAPTKPKERLCIYTDALCYRQNLFKRRYGDLLMMILSNGDTHRTGRGGFPICPHQFTNGT